MRCYRGNFDGAKWKGYEVFYLIGDININSLKYNVEASTSEYLDMLLGKSFMPIITKATRITNHASTPIDHIYRNVPQKYLNQVYVYSPHN